MSMNSFSLQADSNLVNFWDTVGITANGQIYNNARRISLHLETGESESDYGISEGGVFYGSEPSMPPTMTIENGDGTINPDGSYTDGTYSDILIFPGSLDIQIGNRAIRVELFDPRNNFLAIRVYSDGINGTQGIEITERIQEIHIDIDAISGTVTAWYSYVTSEMLGIANVETVTMI